MSLPELLERALRRALEDPERLPLRAALSPDEIASILSRRFPLDRPRALEGVFEETDALLLEHGEHSSHPGYFGLFRPAVDRAPVYAEALAAVHDVNLAVRRFAPAAAGIERYVLSTIAARFGPEFETGAFHFTSGGQEANHSAVIVALGRQFPDFARAGLRALPGSPCFYLSREGHHSFDKIAQACGLGRDAMRRIPADAAHRMDPDALGAAIATDRAAGRLPFLVVATAGTTSAGSIDPLPALAERCRREGLWLHVDAAWAGAAALSPSLRPLLDGIDQADSITCDAHKWLSMPVGAGMFFCRHLDAVKASFAVDPAYAPPIRGDWGGYTASMQWSRRFLGLKLFFALSELGLDGLARRLEAMTELGRGLREGLRERGFRLLNDTPLPLVCFTDRCLQGSRRLHQRFVQKVHEAGRVWISSTALEPGGPALRACVTNFRSTAEHVRDLWDEMERVRREMGGAPRGS